jgi:hypothetical protein
MMQGTIHSIRTERGFGFLRDTEGARAPHREDHRHASEDASDAVV